MLPLPLVGGRGACCNASPAHLAVTLTALGVAGSEAGALLTGKPSARAREREREPTRASQASEPAPWAREPAPVARPSRARCAGARARARARPAAAGARAPARARPGGARADARRLGRASPGPPRGLASPRPSHAPLPLAREPAHAHAPARGLAPLAYLTLLRGFSDPATSMRRSLEKRGNSPPMGTREAGRRRPAAYSRSSLRT
jgi:hypothetical protein